MSLLCEKQDENGSFVEVMRAFKSVPLSQQIKLQNAGQVYLKRTQLKSCP